MFVKVMKEFSEIRVKSDLDKVVRGRAWEQAGAKPVGGIPTNERLPTLRRIPRICCLGRRRPIERLQINSGGEEDADAFLLGMFATPRG